MADRFPLFYQLTGKTPPNVRHADEQAQAERAFQRQARLDELTTASKLRQQDEIVRLAAARNDVQESLKNTQAHLIATLGPEKGKQMFDEMVSSPGMEAYMKNRVAHLAGTKAEAQIEGAPEEVRTKQALGTQNDLNALLRAGAAEFKQKDIGSTGALADEQVERNRLNKNKGEAQQALYTDYAKLAGAANAQAGAETNQANLAGAVAAGTNPSLLSSATNSNAQATTAANEAGQTPMTINNDPEAVVAGLQPMTGPAAALAGWKKAGLLPSALDAAQIRFYGGRTALSNAKADETQQQADLTRNMYGGTTATPLVTGTASSAPNVPGPDTAAPNSTSTLGTGEKTFDPKKGPASKFFKPKK